MKFLKRLLNQRIVKTLLILVISAAAIFLFGYIAIVAQRIMCIPDFHSCNQPSLLSLVVTFARDMQVLSRLVFELSAILLVAQGIHRVVRLIRKKKK